MPYETVKKFEDTIAKWAGAKYGVAVESCCAAIFLCLECHKKSYCLHLLEKPIFQMPPIFYPGVAMSAIHAGYYIRWIDEKWDSGEYHFPGTPVIDSALCFRKDMHKIPNTFRCLSFHYKKHLPIGRGGMILTDDNKAVEWLKMARFDGRKEIPLEQDNATICGWNMYMEPAQAARGLALFQAIKDKDLPDLKVEDQHYPDLSKWRCFRE